MMRSHASSSLLAMISIDGSDMLRHAGLQFGSIDMDCTVAAY